VRRRERKANREWKINEGETLRNKEREVKKIGRKRKNTEE
jgi:hypothetical protein